MKAIKLFLIIDIIILMTAVESAGSPFSGQQIKFKKRSVNLRDTALVNSVVRRGFLSISKSVKPEKIKDYIDSAMIICDRMNIEIPAGLHLLMAEYHYAAGDLRTASEEAVEAMKKSEDNEDQYLLARTMLFFGKYYHRTGQFKESMEYFENSITLAEKRRLKGIVPRGYMGQSNLYNTVGDYSGYVKSLSLLTDAGIREKDTAAIETGYSRLGTFYCGHSPDDKNRNFRKADSLLKISLAVSLKGKDTASISFSSANLGWNFYLEKLFDSSTVYYNKALKYSISAGNHSASANSLGNLGTIYRDLGNIEKSLAYYAKSIEQAKKVNDSYNLQWVYKDMSDLYLRIRDTSNAFNSYVLYKQYNDGYITNENNKGLADARLRYEAETHAKEVELLSLRLKNNRLLNYGLAGFMVLAGTIGLLLFRGSKLKAKRRISEMNRKISEVTQANLRQQMNPHFIFNTLNSIQYYMYQHDKLATNNYLTKFSNLMRKVLDNSQHTSIPLAEELGALNLYLELECIRFKDKFTYEIKVDDEIDPLMYKVPTMLIQPYVENSICHGLMPREGKGFVRIEIKLLNDYLLCTIEDNGVGREAARERSIKRECNHNSLGTQITASRLDLVNALYGTSLKTVYTDLKNEAGEATGTRVEINIPIMI